MADHGTTTRYRYGCRCDLCRAAKKQIRHICKCDECRARRARYMRTYLDRHPEQRAKANARRTAADRLKAKGFA